VIEPVWVFTDWRKLENQAARLAELPSTGRVRRMFV